MATSAEELSSQADNLRELIGFFKVNESDISYKTKAFTHTSKPSAKPVLNKKQNARSGNVESKGLKIDMGSEFMDSDYEKF